MKVGASVPFGLLSVPTMQISGNGSSSRLLNWFADSAARSSIPRGTLISFPLWVYRLVMLAWSLWLAISLPKWLSWAWKIYSQGGFWHSVPKKETTTTGEAKQ